MNARWTLCNGPIRLRVAESARRDGVLVAVTCGDGAGSMPDLGFGEGDAAASPKDRRRLADAVGVEPGRLVFMQQVHGGQVAAVDASRAGAGLHCRGDAVSAADAMTTASAAVALVALSADCPLVALWDARARTVAVAHAGWRGLAAGVLPHTVAALVGLGADAGRMAAAVGPAIGPCCYEVGRDVARARPPAGNVPAPGLARGGAASVARGGSGGRPHRRRAVVYDVLARSAAQLPPRRSPRRATGHGRATSAV